MAEDEAVGGGLTRRQLVQLGAAAALTPSIAAAAPSAEAGRFRPQVHYSPARGFMNDPNGLILHDGEYENSGSSTESRVTIGACLASIPSISLEQVMTEWA